MNINDAIISYIKFYINYFIIIYRIFIYKLIQKTLILILSTFLMRTCSILA